MNVVPLRAANKTQVATELLPSLGLEFNYRRPYEYLLAALGGALIGVTLHLLRLLI